MAVLTAKKSVDLLVVLKAKKTAGRTAVSKEWMLAAMSVYEKVAMSAAWKATRLASRKAAGRAPQRAAGRGARTAAWSAAS